MKNGRIRRLLAMLLAAAMLAGMIPAALADGDPAIPYEDGALEIDAADAEASVAEIGELSAEDGPAAAPEEVADAGAADPAGLEGEAPAAHTHSFTYGVVDGTIIAACGEAGCDLPGRAVALTLGKPAMTIQDDGNSPEAILDGLADFNAATGMVLGGSDIQYFRATRSGATWEKAETLQAAPAVAGDYIAELTLAGVTPAVMASVRYTIQSNACSASLRATKAFTAWDKAERFAFTLAAGSNTAGVETPMPQAGEGGYTREVTANGPTADFGEIRFTAPGVYNYTITELLGDVPGVIYDTVAHDAVVTVEKAGNGMLVPSVLYDGAAGYALTISNSYVALSVALGSWTYGDAPAEPVVPAVYAQAATFEYFTDAACTRPTGAAQGTTEGGRPACAGTYWVRAKVPTAETFVANTSAPVGFTIGKRAITVKATDQTIAYGEELDGAGYEIARKSGAGDGLAAGDTPVVTLTPSTTDVTDSGVITASLVVMKGELDVTDSYTIETTDGALVVRQATPVVTAPTPVLGLTYVGEDQPLVAAGSTSGGTLQYAVTADTGAPDDSAYGEALPTGKERGDYYIWYRVVGNDNYASVAAAMLVEPVSIGKAGVRVAVTGTQSTVTYDGQAHTAIGYTAVSDNPLYDPAQDIRIDDPSRAVASQKTVGETAMGLQKEWFSNRNDDFDVQIEVEDGWQKVVPALATVKIVGHTDEVDFDGEAHAVSGYDVTCDNPLYDWENDLEFSGTAKAEATDAGDVAMGLTAEQFSNKNANFDVTFDVTDGGITILPIGVVVTILGQTDEVDYDGEAHAVNGYTATVNDANYDVEKDFTFTGEAAATRTDAGATPMGLTAAQFANTNANFENVVFRVTDGWVKINAISATVTVVGNTGEAEYDGQPHETTGYAITAVPALYDPEKDVAFTGEATAARTDAGTTPMGLTAAQFANTNPNFDNVVFQVTDGGQTVAPKAATVTAEDQSKVYGEADPALTAKVDGLLEGEAESLIAYTVSREPGEDVKAGGYAITPAGEAVQGNYKVEYKAGVMTIRRAAATVTAQDASKVYGEKDPAMKAVVTGLAEGDAETLIAYTLSREDGEDVKPGGYAILPAGAAEQGNYDVTYRPGTLTITEAPTTATPPVAVKGLVYDGKAHALVTAGSAEGGTMQYALAGENYTTEIPVGTRAGSYTVYYRVMGDVNHSDIAPDSLTVTIGQRPVTIVGADAENKIYDGTVKATVAGTMTLEGLVGSDDVTVVPGTASFADKEADKGKAVAFAGFGLAGADAGNYSLPAQPADAKADISPREAGLYWADTAFTYDGQRHQPSVVATGLLEGDTCEATVIGGQIDAGEYYTAAVELSNPNYRLPSDIRARFTIDRAPLKVTAQAKKKRYGEADPALTYTVTGLVAGDDMSGALTRQPGEASGSYDILLGTLTAGDNYELRYTGAKLTIEARPDPSGVLVAKMVASGTTALKVTWTEMKNVDGYDVFMAPCHKALVLAENVEAGETRSYTATGLKKNTGYEAEVRAYVYEGNRKVYVSTSLDVHAFTGQYKSGRTNAKAISVNKTSLSLKKGKTQTLKVSLTVAKKGKKLLNHVADVRYFSTNTDVAKVTSKGKVKGMGKGTCYVWCVAHNGLYKKVKVTVK